MTEERKDSDDLESQISLISVSKRWWHVCVILLCVQTLCWMAFIWWGEKDDAGSYRELIEAMVYGTSRAIPLFLVLSIAMPLAVEFIGGFIVVLAQYLIRKFEKRGEERGIEVGKAEGIEIGKERGIEIGRAEGIEIGEARGMAAWRTWYRKMKDAEARGEPFDEPPPSMER